MDINAKEFKYSFIKKLLCVLLSFATILGAGWLAAFSVCSLGYFEGIEVSEDFTSSNTFKHNLQWDLSDLMSYVYNTKTDEEHRTKLREIKNNVVEEAYKQYIEINRKITDNDNAYDDWINSEYDYEYTTFAVESDIIVSLTSADVKEEFAVSYYDISSDTPKENIEEIYDIFVANYGNFSYYDFYDVKSVRCYAKYKDFEATNFTDYNVTKDDVTKADIYISYVDGNLTSKGISQKTIDYLKDVLFNSANYNGVEVYLFFDMPEKSSSMLAAIENYDRYVGMRDFYDTACKYIAHFDRNIVVAAILLISSFIFAFLYFTVAGKKNEDEKAKLAFIDYVPFEIHIGISGACVFGLACAVFELIDKLPLTDICAYGMVLAGAGAWWIIFEFVSSFARSVMSDRKFYKFFLTYWFGFAIYKLIRLSIRLDVIILKAMKKSAQKSKARVDSIFRYRPNVLKSNTIALTVLYFICNIFYIALMFLIFFAGELWILSILMGIVLIVINALIINRVVHYLVNLDKIIHAASEHREPVLDLDKLESSLRVLAESMKYTNAELQAAVAKAVKDERLRSELITNVSHDLKTPLTSIITYVDLLSKCDINDDKAKEYIKVLDDKGAKLKRLIDDLIEASKVTSGNVSVNLTTINLAELCLQSTVDAQSDFEKAGLDLVVKDCERAPVIMADGSKTFRVIENLLSNARKYSAKASRVYVEVYSQNGYGIFEIKNISAAPLDISPDELTERFVRGDKSRNQEGNGLGLSIAKELCKLQNGTLELIIDGDLFKARVRLPLAK